MIFWMWPLIWPYLILDAVSKFHDPAYYPPVRKEVPKRRR